MSKLTTEDRQLIKEATIKVAKETRERVGGIFRQLRDAGLTEAQIKLVDELMTGLIKELRIGRKGEKSEYL